MDRQQVYKNSYLKDPPEDEIVYIVNLWRMLSQQFALCKAETDQEVRGGGFFQHRVKRTPRQQIIVSPYQFAGE